MAAETYGTSRFYVGNWVVRSKQQGHILTYQCHWWYCIDVGIDIRCGWYRIIDGAEPWCYMSQQYESEVELGVAGESSCQTRLSYGETLLKSKPQDKRAQENACHWIISDPQLPEWSLLNYQMDSLKWRKTPIYLAHSHILAMAFAPKSGICLKAHACLRIFECIQPSKLWWTWLSWLRANSSLRSADYWKRCPTSISQIRTESEATSSSGDLSCP